MELPKLKIGTLTAPIPIVQGGMGVRVSLAPLASAVANEGGIGTISTIGLGDIHAPREDYERLSVEALRTEIQKAQSLLKDKSSPLAINVMGVLSNAEDLVRASVEEGIQMVVYGAGLPMRLPAWVPDPSVNLVPIISSARVAELICRSWSKKYDRVPDGFILEGPLAGGHLGYSNEQMDNMESCSVEVNLPEILQVLEQYEDQCGRRIPVIVAGGIYTGEDVARIIQLGASGVQMGTRFVATHECSVSDEFKQAFLDAKKEDIKIVKSPVGMPARALRNNFLDKLERGEKIKVRCSFRCLTACKMKEAKYCIADKLLDSYFGKIAEGLIFCGQNVHRVSKVVSVRELFQELLEGCAQVGNEKRINFGVESEGWNLSSP